MRLEEKYELQRQDLVGFKGSNAVRLWAHRAELTDNRQVNLWKCVAERVIQVHRTLGIAFEADSTVPMHSFGKAILRLRNHAKESRMRLREGFNARMYLRLQGTPTLS